MGKAEIKQSEMTMAKLRELFDEAVKTAEKFNTVVKTDKLSEIKQARENVNKAVEAYNQERRNIEYDKLLKQEKPFLAAIEKCTISIYKARYPMDEAGRETCKIEPATEIISLPELEKQAGKTIAADKFWELAIEKFTMLMAARATEDIGGDITRFERFYKISSAARKCDIGPTPTSNTSLTNMLQSIVDKIIYEDNGKKQNVYKVIVPDVKFILYTMCGRGRKVLTVSMPRVTTMISLITEVMHRIVTKAAYTADYDIVKEK